MYISKEVLRSFSPSPLDMTSFKCTQQINISVCLTSESITYCTYWELGNIYQINTVCIPPFILSSYTRMCACVRVCVRACVCVCLHIIMHIIFCFIRRPCIQVIINFNRTEQTFLLDLYKCISS